MASRSKVETSTVEIDHRVGWSRKIDNRRVATPVTVSQKIISFEETFNKLRTFTSLDIASSFTASAQGEIAGIGGSVSHTSSIAAHTEVETEKMNHVKREKIIDDTTVLDYPGPVLWDEDTTGARMESSTARAASGTRARSGWSSVRSSRSRPSRR